MNNFKKHLALFTSVLTLFSFAATTAVYALDMSEISGKTNNIDLNTTNGIKFNIDMKAGAKKGAVAQVDWTKYNVDKDQTVKYGFSNSAQTIINRVVGAGSTSFINGKIVSGCTAGVSCGDAAASGKVLLINPAGVVFGKGSVIDLNSFTVSTKDIKGLKNLKDVNNLTDYENSLGNLSKSITFVSDGNTTATVWLDGTSITGGKSIGVVADNIVYKDSLIKTTDANSNVKLVTADGVTFVYEDDGRISSSASEAKNLTKKSINMDNSGLQGEAISSSDILIESNSNLKDSYTQITRSIIKGTKLVQDDKGNIHIAGNNTILGYAQADAQGDLTIDANNAAQVYSKSELKAGGNVDIYSSKTALIKDAKIDAKSLAVNADDKATVNNSRINATNDVRIASKNQTHIKNSTINGDNKVSAESLGNVFVEKSNLNSSKGIVGVSATKGFAKVYSNSNINADEVIVDAKNSYIENSVAKARNISVFADENATVINSELDTSAAKGNSYTNQNGFGLMLENGQVSVGAGNQAYVKNSNINAKNDVRVDSVNGSAFVENSKLTSKDASVSVSAKNTAKVYNESKVSAGTTANIDGNAVYVKNATINAKNIKADATNTTTFTNVKATASESADIKSKKQLLISDSNINAKTGVKAESTEGSAFVKTSTLKSTNGNVIVKALNGTAQVYKNSTLNSGAGIAMNGKNSGIYDSSVTAKKLSVKASDKATLSNVKATLSETASIESKNQLLISKSNINATKGVKAESTNGSAFVKASEIKAANGNVVVKALKGNAQVYDNSTLNSGASVAMNGKNTYIEKSSITANKLTIDASNNVTLANVNATVAGAAATKATNQILFSNSNIKANGGVSANSEKGSIFVKASDLNSVKNDVNIDAAKTAQVYQNSTIKAGDAIRVSGKKSNISDSSISAKKLNVNATDKTYVFDSKINTTSATGLKANNGVYAANTKVNNKNIVVNGKKSVIY